MSLAVPNLPGFRKNDQPVRRRPQNFINIKGQFFEKKIPEAEVDPMTRMADRALELKKTSPSAKMELTSRKTLVASGRAAMGMGHADVPIEVVLDRQVLRVYGYFQEAVHESPLEDARVRKLVITYFLVNNTMMMQEPKDKNSGMPQGAFMGRRRVIKKEWSSGEVEYYGPEDLVIGTEVTIDGRTIRIVDCDKATRDWYKERGVDQGAAEPYPKDSFAVRKEALAGTGDHKKKMYPMKKYQEARLGKFQRDPEKLAQFLRNDRKVLRFDGLWDDSRSLYGDKNRFTVHYFLADDTIEVNEVAITNSGKDAFPTLVKRERLARDWHRQREAVETENPDLFFKPMDLVVGDTINVYGRNIELRACDPFTRQYYRQVHGFEQPDSLPGYVDRSEGKADFVPPPYTGFGDEDDSLASCLSLVPKPPKKDFNKFMQREREVFRYEARFATPTPEDAVRKFIVQFYPADDTLSIYEPSQRNTGIVGGKFLMRGKHKVKDGSRLFCPEDFTPGTIIEIAKRVFRIIEADKFTRDRIPEVDMDRERKVDVSDDLRAILDKVKEACAKADGGAHGINAFANRVAASGSDVELGVVTSAVRTVSSGAISLGSHEAAMLGKAFDKYGDDKVNVEELVDALRGTVSPARKDAIERIWSKVSNGADSVSAADLAGYVRFSWFPKVRAGSDTADEARADFVGQLPASVSAADFVTYMLNVSAVVESDAYFARLLEKVWAV